MSGAVRIEALPGADPAVAQRTIPAAALAVAAASAASDLLTKWWAYGAIPLGGTRPLLGDWLVLHTRSNPAGPWSWGLGTVPPAVMRAALPLLSVLAVAILLRILWRADPRDRLKALGLALILGGAAGNLWDRAITAFDPSYGGVRDFILFPRIVFGRPFPAFNLADTWITVGVVLVGWRLLFEKEREPAAPAAPADPAAPAPADEVRA